MILSQFGSGIVTISMCFIVGHIWTHQLRSFTFMSYVTNWYLRRGTFFVCLNIINTQPPDILVRNNARLSAGAVITTMIPLFLLKSLHYWWWWVILWTDDGISISEDILQDLIAFRVLNQSTASLGLVCQKHLIFGCRPQAREFHKIFASSSKIFFRNLYIAEIVLPMIISSRNFICVPKVMLWAHIV